MNANELADLLMVFDSGQVYNHATEIANMLLQQADKLKEYEIIKISQSDRISNLESQNKKQRYQIVELEKENKKLAWGITHAEIDNDTLRTQVHDSRNRWNEDLKKWIPMAEIEKQYLDRIAELEKQNERK